MRRLPAYPVYLSIEFVLWLAFGMIFTASSVYQVEVVGLSALQLVLVGTMLETSVFLFEVPTGVVADVYSRRLSIVIGMFLIGLGFLIEGSFPIFWTILLAQAFWGIGYTFTSGATQAWISDEIGEAEAGKAFLRSTQVGLVAELAGLGLGMAIGSLRVSLPIQLGGLLIIALGVFLAVWMPETGFNPTPRGERSTWAHLRDTFSAGWNTVRGRPTLLAILGIGLFYGLYSEGFDRLWTKHLLENFPAPFGGALQPVVFIGALRAVGTLLSVGAAGLARRRLATDRYAVVARVLFGVTALLIAGLFTFALAGPLALAVLAYWIIDMSRSVISPLYTAWVNQRLDSQVRATVLSMSSQVDAIGQIAGGPVVGLIGSLASVRAALFASATILSPVLLLFRRALRLNEKQPVVFEPVAGEDG